MPDANARLAIAGILAISGIVFRLVPPIDTVLARQDIVQASVGHLADMRIIDDVDAGDDEREHHAGHHCAKHVVDKRHNAVRL